MYTQTWSTKVGDSTHKFADTGDGYGELRRFTLSAGTDVFNSAGYGWTGLPSGSYETVPGNPAVIIDPHKGTMFHSNTSNSLNRLQEKPPMSTVQKIQQERRENRERGAYERMYSEWDAAETGKVGVFLLTVKGETQRRLCTIVNTHEDRDGEPLWSILGRLNDVTWEDALAWLVENRVAADEVDWV